MARCTAEAGCFYELLDTRNHGWVVPRSRRAKAVFHVHVSPSWDTSVEELLDFSVQTRKIVKIPLPRIVTAVTSVIFILCIEGQFELFADLDALVAKGR